MSVSPQLPETKDEQPPSAIARKQPSDPIRDDSLSGILAATLERMADEWQAGQARPAEKWLADYPELNADPEAAVRIVYEECCLREERGEQVESAELYRRFPQWHEALEVVLDCHRLLRNIDEPPTFPATGQRLGEFRLLRELGRGGQGRVFLATQPSLSDRPLVVKLTAPTGQEHLSLARLQHTNIVPLYLVQDFPQENLRALCMPYLGGSTWSAVLQRLHGRPLADLSGRQIVECLADARPESSTSIAGMGPALGFLARSTFADAVCWIGACLADALSYAHQRGLVHLDVKPSNVLLAGDGQPMLLDFHLACETQRLQDMTIERLGGTPGFMSPEQRAAAEAIRRGDSIPRPLDARSDIYSLGVLLYEALAGQPPVADAARSRRELRKANPQVSQGLEDIVHKCLSPAPAARYSDAGVLAADLRRHLASLPLRGVANRSLVERWRKWRRRRPSAVPLLMIGLITAAFVSGVGGLYYRDRIWDAQASLVQSQLDFNNKDFARSIQHAQVAWGDLRWFPWQGDLKNRIKLQIAATRQAQAVAALHDLVEQLRFFEGQKISDHKLAEIAAGCHKIWQDRGTLVAAADGDATDRHNGVLDEQLRHDLLDLAVLSARIDVQLAPPARTADARREALRMLGEARQTCGPSPLLDLEERDYSTDARPGSAEIQTDALPTARNAWEHYALGRWLMRHGSFNDAARQFAAAIDLQPDEFWAHFQQTRCQFELRQFESALASATVCVALAPRRAECFFNRALCQESLGHNREALADIGRSLELDPRLAPAALARGALFSRLGRFAEATADLDSALAHGSRPSDVDYQTARLHLARHDTAAALEWLRKSLAEDPANPAAIALDRELRTGSR
jgi:serine/threonine protein kinase/Tfp pilus assembly protein PilF